MSLPRLPESASIDLLLATLGRVNELDRLLTSLAGQTYKNFRILLADQNPPGYLDGMLERHADLPITRVMLPSLGVSIARNALLEHAAGDIIAFPDDDCWYAPDTLERVCETFGAHDSCGSLLGVWTASPDVYARGVHEGIVSRVGLFHLAGTCVQFYRKEVIKGIRFDHQLGPGTDLPYGCGEDTDYLLHTHALTEVRRYKKIRVFHPAPEASLPPPEKVTSYAAGRMYLLKKHKFPIWFILANILFPLCALPLGMLKHGGGWAKYRWQMFKARLQAWIYG